MNMVPISVMLLIVGFGVGAWYGFQWLFGWQEGLGLLVASIVVAGVAYQGLTILVVSIRERGDPKP